MIQTTLFIASAVVYWKYCHAADIMMIRGRETALFSLIRYKSFCRGLDIRMRKNLDIYNFITVFLHFPASH